MIRLSNIIRNGSLISAIVTTVGPNSKTFKVVVNIETGDILENTLGKMNMSVNMARVKLIDLVNEHGNKVPNKAECAWY